VAAGGGEGVLVEKASGKETFMEMGSAGVGLGAGAKNFRAIFLFFDSKQMEKFKEKGWEFGGSADATAKANDGGAEASGAGSANMGMMIYQFTETGIALQATVAGTKYWKDKKLNEGL
jgi:lipid-binding SYLF domain-containing protein